MAKEKGTYSLISVDVASDEEVVRVDAQGVHHEGPQNAASNVAASFSGSAPQAETQHAEKQQAAKPAHTGASRKVESESYDGRDDLEGPVPMAGLQRGIVAVVVVCLVAFIAYFVVTHG